MKKVLMLILVGLCYASSAIAQEYIEKRFTIFFRVNESTIDRNYMNNGHTIQTMVEDVQNTLNNQVIVPDSLLVFASTSPEGSAALNERLALERAASSRALLTEILPQFNPNSIKVESRANDWSGLILNLRRDASVKHRDTILKILTDPRIENKEAAVRALPEVYAEIRDGMFNYMRTASVTIRVIGQKDEFTVDPELYITSANPMDFPAEGSAGRITFTKNVSDDVLPAVSSSADWIQGLTVTKDGIDFKVAPNTRVESRTAPIKVECYGKTLEVVVNQDAATPILTVTSPSLMDFPAEGDEGVITFIKNGTDSVVPVVTSDATWLKINTTDTDKATFTVAENHAEQPRSANLTVEAYGKTYDVVVNQEPAVKVLKPFYMAAKTNMLYDLAIVPNVGLEFYLGKNFSVAGNWMYSWWNSDKKAWYWRTYGGDLAVRYWFGKAAKEKPLTGHHVGLYGQIVTYDFEVGGRGYLGDRWSYGGGVEYGYSLPIAKRLNIDFNLGVGYLGGEYKEYLPIDGHYVWQVTKHRHWFGPTKAEISLSWLLGRGNENKGKGGKR